MTNIRKTEAFLREQFANCTYLHDVSYYIFLSVVIGIGTIHLTGCGSDFVAEPTETAIISLTDIFCEDDTQFIFSVFTCENVEAKELEYHLLIKNHRKLN